MDRLLVQKHALAFSISPLVMIDLAGRLTYANPAALKAWGYESESEVLNRPVVDFCADSDQLTAYLGKVRTNGESVSELIAKRKDGSNFDAEVLGSLMLDDRGQPIGMVVSCLDVTARKAAEARLRESESRYRTLVENIDLGITLIDRQHRIVAVNGVHAKMVGRPVDECLGQECFRVFEKREAVCLHCPGTKAMQTGEPAEAETSGVRDDGTTYAARVQAFPVHGSDRHLEGFIEVVEDITDRKREQDALRRATFCVEQAADSIFWIDPEGKIVLANQKACEVLEYSKEELHAMTVFDIDPMITREWWRPHWEALREKKSFIIETCHRTKTGQIFPVEVGVNYMTFEGNDYNCVFARDIRGRKEAEKQLAHFSAIIDSSHDAIIGKSLDGIVTSWNPGAEHLYGYTAAEMIGQPISTLTPHDRCDEIGMLLSRIGDGGRVEQYDTVRRRKDGTLVDVSLTLSPIKNNDGKIIGASAIAHEITNRKRAEQELNRAKQAADAANRTKSEFLANMSHEIRTPMTAILGFADVLMDGAREQETIESAQIIKRNGEHLLNIINDILDLSKIEAGKCTVDLLKCSPIHIASEVISLMKVRADAEGLPLTLDVRGIVPEKITTDPTRLRQILVNLIGNAIKFTEVGHVRVAMRLDIASESEDKLIFDVIDTGIGMSEAQMGLLFQPFSQVDGSARRRFGGNGLGLAISKRMAGTLGGDIVVRSSPGQGSTFSLSIGTGHMDGQATPLEPSKAMTARQLAGNVPQKLTCRILLAEDGPDNQRLIGFLLRKAGAKVEVAENGQIALDLALAARQAGRPFDIILMDMQMPVMDGYEATQNLRRAGYREPIIALTAHAMTTDRQKCIDAGCDDYITKPIDPKKFAGLLEPWVARELSPV
jgi:PAS domain S-box-containing protein